MALSLGTACPAPKRVGWRSKSRRIAVPHVLDTRRSWLVWPYLVDRAQDHFAVWEAVIAIEQRADRPIEAYSVGRVQ